MFCVWKIAGSSWADSELTWRLTNPTNKLPWYDVERDVEAAFVTWQLHSGLSFHKAEDENVAQLEVSWQPQNHGDEFDFDGPGGVLGHAFFPSEGGAIHFDDSESWTVNAETGASHSIYTRHRAEKKPCICTFLQDTTFSKWPCTSLDMPWDYVTAKCKNHWWLRITRATRRSTNFSCTKTTLQVHSGVEIFPCSLIFGIVLIPLKIILDPIRAKCRVQINVFCLPTPSRGSAF